MRDQVDRGRRPALPGQRGHGRDGLAEYLDRDDAREDLAIKIPEVVGRAGEQMDAILEGIGSGANSALSRSS